jgi:hypothetical protein
MRRGMGLPFAPSELVGPLCTLISIGSFEDPFPEAIYVSAKVLLISFGSNHPEPDISSSWAMRKYVAGGFLHKAPS